MARRIHRLLGGGEGLYGLFTAARLGDLARVKALVRAGYDVNEVQLVGLVSSAFGRFLFDGKVGVHKTEEETARIEERWRSEMGRTNGVHLETRLLLGEAYEHADVVEYLVREAGIDTGLRHRDIPSRSWRNGTVLYEAIMHPRKWEMEGALRLMDLGATPPWADGSMSVVEFMCAAAHDSSPGMLAHLLEHHAAVLGPALHQTCECQPGKRAGAITPLQMAVRWRYAAPAYRKPEVMALLLNHARRQDPNGPGAVLGADDLKCVSDFDPIAAAFCREHGAENTRQPTSSTARPLREQRVGAPARKKRKGDRQVAKTPKPKQRKRAGGTTKKQKRVGRARAIQVGDRVQKMFGDTMYDGTITEIDTEAPKRGGKRATSPQTLYHVLYADGDTEDLYEGEIRPLLKA